MKANKADTKLDETHPSCMDASDTQRTSLPFVVFELLMVFICTISYFIMRRMRRLSELRTQQRYERLARVEVGFGSNVNNTDHTSVL